MPNNPIDPSLNNPSSILPVFLKVSSNDAPPPSTNGDAGDIPPELFKPPKNKVNKRAVFGILGILLLVGGLGTGMVLLKQSQDIRNRAQETTTTTTGTDLPALSSMRPTTVTTCNDYSFSANSDGVCTVNTDLKLDEGKCGAGRAGSSPDIVAYTVSVIGDDNVTCSGTTGIASGDEVLILNLQGNKTNFSNVGKYEILKVKEVTASKITFTKSISNLYATSADIAGQKVIVQRLPNYSSMTINSGATLSVKPWDGTKGGVLAFKVNGNLVVNGTIDVSGLGGRSGGRLPANGHGSLGGEGPAGYAGTGGGHLYDGSVDTEPGDNSIGGGGGGGSFNRGIVYIGNGIYQQNPNGYSAQTAINASFLIGGGGGGGGASKIGAINAQPCLAFTSGAGGGGGYLTGGFGGNSFNGWNVNNKGEDGGISTNGKGANGRVGFSESEFGARRYTTALSSTAGGGGGGGTYGSLNLATLYFGSAGGPGGYWEENDRPATFPSFGSTEALGGRGGGIIYIIANNISGSGTITSKGLKGVDGHASYGGGGGGGAGGSIKLVVASFETATNSIVATGGDSGGGKHKGGKGGYGRSAVFYIDSIADTENPAVYIQRCTAGGSTQCLNIKIYDTSWNVLDQSDLSQLVAGDKIRFAVLGSTTVGTIDKARFIINGTTKDEVSQKKSGTDEFYYEYTIPSNLTSFTVGAQLHHSERGWF